jgi:CubicO group peptidase (beta-lactamase class C family)
MAKWGAAWLDVGMTNGVALLRTSTVEQMLTPWIDVVPPYARMGLVWMLSHRRGAQLVEHGGGDKGFRSDLLLAPQGKFGVVLMTNCDAWYVHTTSLAPAILGDVLGNRSEFIG